jgi:kinetochore protein NDC80
MIRQLDSLDLEIRNHVSSCTAEARQMKDESEKKENQMSTVEKDADEFLKVLSCFVFLKFILLR